MDWRDISGDVVLCDLVSFSVFALVVRLAYEGVLVGLIDRPTLGGTESIFGWAGYMNI
jgi:hypothetical protein